MDRTAYQSWLRFALQTGRNVEPLWDATHVVQLVGQLDCNPVAVGEEQNILGPSLGASPKLPGQPYDECRFSVRMATSGTAGSPPPWDHLLRACGFGRVDVTGANARCEYRPVSAGYEFGALRWTEGRVYRRTINALGNVTFRMLAGEVPKMDFEFVGARFATAEHSSLSMNYAAAWDNVAVITDDNSGDVRLGCTYNSTTGAVTGGTVYPSFGLTLNAGVQVKHSPILGLSGATIERREPEIDLMLYLTATQDIALEQMVRDIEYTTLGWNLGTADGHRIAWFFPKVQLAEVRSEQRDGRLMRRFRVLPVPTGPARDDDMRLILR